MGIGWMLAVSVLLGTLGGVYADRWLGTTPWLTLLGIALGMAAGFVSVFRTLLAPGGAGKAGTGGPADPGTGPHGGDEGSAEDR